MSPSRLERILAIHPTSKGFGFVVMEGPDRLADWGVKESKNLHLNSRLRLLCRLLDRYHPTTLAVEPFDGPKGRRSRRARQFLVQAIEAAMARTIKVRIIPREQVEQTFAHVGRTNHRIAESISWRLPELARHLPPPRATSASEDVRISMFHAAALGITIWNVSNGRSATRKQSRETFRHSNGSEESKISYS